MWNLKKAEFVKTESRMVVGGDIGEMMFKGTNLQLINK